MRKIAAATHREEAVRLASPEPNHYDNLAIDSSIASVHYSLVASHQVLTEAIAVYRQAGALQLDYPQGQDVSVYNLPLSSCHV